MSASPPTPSTSLSIWTQGDAELIDEINQEKMDIVMKINNKI
jgi:hypothetical protein